MREDLMALFEYDELEKYFTPEELSGYQGKKG
jgi:hypothetical protein